MSCMDKSNKARTWIVHEQLLPPHPTMPQAVSSPQSDPLPPPFPLLHLEIIHEAYNGFPPSSDTKAGLIVRKFTAHHTAQDAAAKEAVGASEQK